MKRWAPAIFGILLPSLALAQSPKAKAPTISPQLLSAIKAGAAKKLKDPYSAQFERMTAATRPNVKGQPTDVVCGYVNAKNSFGAYAGAAPFLFFVKDGDFWLREPSDTILFPAMAKTFCEGLH